MLLGTLAVEASRKYNINKIGLAGGVLQNSLMARLLAANLAAHGCGIVVIEMPAGDGREFPLGPGFWGKGSLGSWQVVVLRTNGATVILAGEGNYEYRRNKSKTLMNGRGNDRILGSSYQAQMWLNLWLRPGMIVACGMEHGSFGPEWLPRIFFRAI